FGNRFDVSVIAWLLIQRLAERGYIAVQIPFFDETVRPDGLHQLFFADRFARLFQKCEQNSEHRRRDWPRAAGSTQEKLSRVDTKLIEFVDPSFCHHGRGPGMLVTEGRMVNCGGAL